MAFSEFRKKRITDEVVIYDSFLANDFSSLNILRRATIGYSSLLKEIGSSVASSKVSEASMAEELEVYALPMLKQRYNLIEHLGDGSFSQAYLARDLWAEKV